MQLIEIKSFKGLTALVIKQLQLETECNYTHKVTQKAS